MKYSLELLKADIQDELTRISRVEMEYQKIEDKLKLDDIEVPYYDRGAIGYILHNFYNGCENIFRNIARFFENDLDDTSWHRDLLKRMRIEIPGFRPRVIDEELYELLDDFRAFRHRYRHSYAFELDWEKERFVARRFHRTLSLFRLQIMLFLKSFEEIKSHLI